MSLIIEEVRSVFIGRTQLRVVELLCKRQTSNVYCVPIIECWLPCVETCVYRFFPFYQNDTLIAEKACEMVVMVFIIECLKMFL